VAAVVDLERLRSEVKRLHAKLDYATITFSEIAQWCKTLGDDLCPRPGCGDTYGEGMREAKTAVNLLLRKDND